MKTLDLTTGSITKHVRDLALPSSIGLFFQTMYNVVDSFYAGKISTEALAALGFSFPVYLLVIAASSGLSRGSSALIANAIGAREADKQHLYVSQAFSLGGFVSVFLTAFGFTVARPLFELLGASGVTMEAAMQYMTPIFIGAVFFVATNLCNAILVANGDSKTFGKVLVVGFFLNLILDPWFLFGGFGLPAMGISGIAWATVAIQVASSVFMVSTVLKRELLDLSSWRVLIPNFKTYLEIAEQALPASFNVMSVAMGFLITTYFLKFYGDATVASFGVTTRIEQIVLMPTFGLYTAIMALVGQNNGAKKYDRIGETMRTCNLIGMTLNIISSILIYVFAGPLMRIFTADEAVIEIGVDCIRILAFIQWCYLTNLIHLAMLQAIKRPMYGFFETVIRKIILPLPFLWIFVFKWGFDVTSVWWIIAGTSLLMTIITVAYAQTVLRKLMQNKNPKDKTSDPKLMT